MKTIYLVRHGESIVNVSDHFLEESSGLTEKGLREARFIAARAEKLRLSAMIASPWGRTAETAALIANTTGLPIEYSDEFVERRRPSSLMGKSKTDPTAVPLHEAWVRSTEGIGPRVEDGEDFSDLNKRAARCLDLLERHVADDILVVSHGYFARVLLARMLYGPSLTDQIFYPLANGLRTKHTGLSVFRYDPDDARGNTWYVLTWNDHAHLG